MTPQRSLVRPRVLLNGQGPPLCLENAIHLLRTRDNASLIALLGGPGIGKSVALRQLATVLPPHSNLELLDNPDRAEVLEARKRQAVIYAAETALEAPDQHVLRLAGWGRDEWIEYLLANHRAQCAPVMARLERDRDAAALQGHPHLWRLVLDEMAGDHGLPGVAAALRSGLARAGGRALSSSSVAWMCVSALTGVIDSAERAPRSAGYEELQGELARLLRYRAVQLDVATEWMAARLAAKKRPWPLEKPLPVDLLHGCGRAAAGDGRIRVRLMELLAGRDRRVQPSCASILNASGTGWDLPAGRLPRLDGAYLDGVCWPGAALTKLRASMASLSHANLSKARLENARLDGARLAGAKLRGACLDKALAVGADFSAADLSGCSARGARLESAQFQDADLQRACLSAAQLTGCGLERARLTGADLSKAAMAHVAVAGADFSHASLAAARLSNVRLRLATLTGASFRDAQLSACDLEGVDLPGADFGQARLVNCDLTASRMCGANFARAEFEGVGLAHVDWEEVCLRDADLRGVTFHAGSARSGLVDSPLACEGSRTGFYTDESGEQDFRAPEDIRKANLRGADLRGAALDGVDLYLVDLRDARMDPRQRRWAKGCGAILADRTS